MARKRLRHLTNKLRSPSLKKFASELKAGGEFGRALPGAEQQQIRGNIAAEVHEGEPAIPFAQGRTEVSTFFTKGTGDQLLYQAEGWVRLRLMLETAGPVAVGSRDQVSPPLSGKGILLPVNVEITFPVTKGNRIFIASTSVNRVRFIIEPIPWMEQLVTMVGSLLSLRRKGR